MESTTITPSNVTNNWFSFYNVGVLVDITAIYLPIPERGSGLMPFPRAFEKSEFKTVADNSILSAIKSLEPPNRIQLSIIISLGFVCSNQIFLPCIIYMFSLFFNIEHCHISLFSSLFCTCWRWSLISFSVANLLFDVKFCS